MKHLLALIMLAASLAYCAENILQNPTLAAKDAKGIPVGWGIASKLQPVISSTADSVTLSSPDQKEHATLTQQIAKNVELGIPYIVSAEIKASETTEAQFYVEGTVRGADKKVQWLSYHTSPFTVTTDWSTVSFKLAVNQPPNSLYLVIRSRQGKPVTFKNITVAQAPVRKALNGYFDLENQVEIPEEGVMVTKGKPARLFAVPVQAGKTYVLKYDCKGYGETGNDYVFHPIIVQAKPYGIKGGYFFNDVKNTPMPKAQKLVIPADATYKTIDVQFSTSSTGKVHFYNFSFGEYIPDITENWRLFIDTPYYRDMIFSSHDAGVIAGTVEAQAPAAKAAIDIAGVGQASAAFANGKAGFAIPAKGLKDGKYTLTCNVQDAAGKTMKTFTKVITKVPVAKNEVIGSKSRYFLVNDKPFFPVTQWTMPYNKDEACLYQAARNGINSTFIHLGNDTQKSKEMLDLLDKFGIKAIISIGCCATLSPKELKTYRMRIEDKLPPELRQHPAIIAYFMTDEPLWGGRPAAPLQATLDILKDFDPYHPVWINAAPRNEVEDLIPYGEACDIFGVDIYPIPYPNSHSGLDDKGITSVGKYTSRMLDTTFWRKPNWMALQGFAWAALNKQSSVDTHVYPTDTQMRFMAFDTMLNGCTGYGLWGTQYIKTPSFYNTIFYVARELHAMSGLYTLGKQEADMAIGNKNVRIVPLTYKDAKYFAIMNLVEKDMDVTFDTGLGKQTFTIYINGNTLTSPDGKVSFKLPPYGVVFFGNAALPAPAYNLPAPNAQFDAMDNPLKGFILNYWGTRKSSRYYNGNASWIWNKRNIDSSACQTLVAKYFEVTDVNKPVKLFVAADDSSTVYVNGKQIGKTQDWDLLFTFDLKGYIKPGKNLVMIHAADAGALPCGALAELQIDGKTVMKTDDTWMAAPLELKQAFDANSTKDFEPAIIVAPYGGGAWSRNVRIKE